jgi:hypothetical protein
LIHPTRALRLIRAPLATYRESAAPFDLAASGSWVRALGRVLAPVAIIGIATSVAATGRTSWALVLSGTVCWSFVGILQLTTAAMLIASSRRNLRWPRAFELFFLAHAPWSLWLLALTAAIVALPIARQYLNVILLTFLLPGVWSAAVIFAFCREILQLDSRRAAIATALHQVVTYTLIVAYIAWAVQLWPRVLSLRAS